MVFKIPVIIFLTLACFGFSQDFTNGGTFTGNIESTFQYLNNDTLIGANQPVEKLTKFLHECFLYQ